MAVQAGVGVSKVLLLVGAGVTGSVLLRNSKVSDLLNDVPKVLAKHLKEEGDGSSNGGETSTLYMQVHQLTQELRQLAASSRDITVVNGTGKNSGNLTSLVVPIAVIGAATYGYMWWKGLSWTEVMYVTRRQMSNAVGSFSKQLEQVSTALTATKRQLTAKIESVTKTLNDSLAMQGLIKDQVIVIREEVKRSRAEIDEVQRLVQGLEVKIDGVQGKQDFANQGIILLCRFVASREMFQQPERLQGFQSWSLNAPSLQPLASDREPPLSGLKKLQYYSELVAAGTPGDKEGRPDAGTANGDGNVTPVPTLGLALKGKGHPSPGLHRGFSCARSLANT